jgi:ankyrin repeat protein
LTGRSASFASLVSRRVPIDAIAVNYGFYADYTTQQYIEKQRETRFPNVEAVIATTCLTYLSFNVFARGHCYWVDEFLSLLNDHPFLDYAARHWGYHARRHQESIKDLVLDFLQDDSKVACASQVLLLSPPQPWALPYSHIWPSDFSGLHILAFFGLEQVLRSQLENGGNVNAVDHDHQTPLSLAAENGHEEVVELLLVRNDIQVNSKDNIGHTPLSLAAFNGQEGVVKQLLARNDIQVNLGGSLGRTPLSLAAENGHEGVVKLLLTHKDIQVNSKDDIGRTPLARAAENGHDGVVMLLRQYLRGCRH